MSRSRRWMLGTVALIGLGFAAIPSAHLVRGADEKPKAEKAGATFEVYQDKAGEFRWRLRATNSQVIASSGQGYKEKRSCIAGIESVKKNAPLAPVEEKKEE